ncbi:hypothetical protein LT337_21920 [Mycolicibacterium fortuitum]|uniref:hypothetical protein n=1 Tax=Mycolicibacterium fortuitum TaxID=1766 RepID=UPI001F3A971A|nr:hypothetical protein [Mycolicibacterium fortuitum]UHJ54138.1 hypothetical protein LT337_21920 [Mycolicibacterium fortuitum]
MASQNMHPLRRSFWALVGVAILGFGSAVLRVAQVGVDPYTAANIGIFFTEKVNKPLMKKDLAALEAFQQRVRTTRWHF